MSLFLCLSYRCVVGFGRRVALPAAVTLALTGCGSVPTATGDRLAVSTAPQGAEVKTSTGESCVSPCTLQLGRGADFTVVVSKRGFKTERFEVGENCASAVDIALRPVASITAFELPDRDLPLIVNCARRSADRLPTGLAPVH